MPEGFDVRPDGLRAAAAGLRGDAIDLDEAGVAVRRALDAAAGATGPGPLTGSATALADLVADVVAASTEYVSGDGAAAASLSERSGSDPPIVVPGLGAPG